MVWGSWNLCGLYQPRGGWAQMEFSLYVFGLGEYSTEFRETHAKVYYVRNYTKT